MSAPAERPATRSERSAAAGGPETAGGVLAGLDPEQRAAVEAPRGPVCVLAGAGTGKTRAITHRIAHQVRTGVAPASQLLAVTFTARAASEMRGRLRALRVEGVQARTFHSAALRQLSYFWPRVVGGDKPRLAESKLRAVGTAGGRCGQRLAGAELRDVAGEIEWAKATVTAPGGYADAAMRAGREPPLGPAGLAEVYDAYEQVKTERGELDFEDLLLLTAAAIEDHPDVAAEVRARYRHFVVDEYQDVNPLQQRLLDAWLGGRDDVCVVGDAAQTIYSFTGASSAFLLDFARRYPSASVVRLVRDYRSTPQVVALANAVLDVAAAPGAAAAEGARRAGAVRLQAQRPAGPEPTLRSYDDEPAEAAAVAARCHGLIERGVPAREIAVLYRVNAQSQDFEQALADAGVAFQVRGGERFFARPEIREAMVLLRGAARSAEPGPLREQVIAAVSGTGWTPEPPAGPGAARERWESVRALVELSGQLPAGTDLAGFVGELTERASAQHPPPVDGVTLASLHAAKGLEWDAVFVVGLADGTLPISYATTVEQTEEERRLLYVGLTRAREHLALSWARSRSPGGRGNRRASRFLDGILGDGEDRRTARSSGRSGVGRRRGGPVRCRVCGRPVASAAERKLGRHADCPGDVDEALFERLRDWRLSRARADDVPAFVVFTDATLTAIAETRPTTEPELLRVSGVGHQKLERYGAEVLAVVGGEPASGSPSGPPGPPAPAGSPGTPAAASGPDTHAE